MPYDLRRVPSNGVSVYNLYLSQTREAPLVGLCGVSSHTSGHRHALSVRAYALARDHIALRAFSRNLRGFVTYPYVCEPDQLLTVCGIVMKLKWSAPQASLTSSGPLADEIVDGQLSHCIVNAVHLCESRAITKG